MANKNKFNEKIKNMERLLGQLLSQPPSRPIEMLDKNLVSLNFGGVYIFSKIINGGEEFLYVGQSKNISERLAQHCAIKNRKHANFAYKETVERSGRKPILYSPNSTKESMFTDLEFKKSFAEVVEDVKRMNFRWLELSDTLEKNLFEIYASVVTQSKFNNFD